MISIIAVLVVALNFSIGFKLGVLLTRPIRSNRMKVALWVAVVIQASIALPYMITIAPDDWWVASLPVFGVGFLGALLWSMLSPPTFNP